MVEIEVKIRIHDVNTLKGKIEDLGALCIKPRHLEKNTLYDFSDDKLYTKQHALRLRSINKKTFLTFKGAKQKSRKFKIRKEYETEI
jgi:adenylate cyclase class 2